MAEFKLSAETTMGPVHLKVSDMADAQDFYGNLLGLTLEETEASSTVNMTVEGEPLVVLTAMPKAQPKPSGTTGLYHFAIRVPTRADLARVLKHLESRYHLQGASDHGVSEAIYLVDPEGNGIEIYADRPREAWPRQDGELEMVTKPLNRVSLLATLNGGSDRFEGLPAGTGVGHVHLQVADPTTTERFYTEILGMEVMQRYGSSALFFSAGGYHHHIGANTWAGQGAPPPPEDAVGLRYFVMRLPDQAALDDLVTHLQENEAKFETVDDGVRLHDPSSNAMVVTTS